MNVGKDMRYDAYLVEWAFGTVGTLKSIGKSAKILVARRRKRKRKR